MVTVTAQETSNGMPIAPTGVPVWTTNRPDLVSLAPVGLDCTITAASPLPVASGGDATVTISQIGIYGTFRGYVTVHVVPVPLAAIPDGFDISVGEIT